MSESADNPLRFPKPAPASPAGPAAPWSTPPSPQHLEQITIAKRLGAKIRNAAGVAIFSGWSTAVFAVLTLLFGLISFSFVGSLLGFGMCVVALNEFKGASRLKRLDDSAPRFLAINQLAFAGMIVVYGAISLWMVMANPAELTKELDQYGGDFRQAGIDIKDSGIDITGTVKLAYIAVYGGVMLFGVIGPGLTAWYYYTRRPYIQQYVAQTPQWILDLQRAGMSL